MSQIALLCATPSEMDCLASKLEDPEEENCPKGMRLVAGRFGIEEILILASGVGKVSAAAGSMYLMDNYAPRALINYGIAGALSPKVKTGDLVIADELFQCDVGIAHSGGFRQTGPGLCEDETLVFYQRHPVSPTLLSICRHAAEASSLPHHMGKIATCDQVVLDPELRRDLARSFGALAVEMEGAAVAQTAISRQVAFAVVRAISDEVSFDFVGLEKLLHKQGESRRHVMRKRFLLTLVDPSILTRARELSAGSRLALANLATLLEVLLPRLYDLHC